MRNSFADLLRLISALLVVMGHTREMLFLDHPGFWWFYRTTGLGMASVMVFFVVSGYSITSEAMHTGKDYSLGAFLFKRLTRLWVVLIPALFITLLCDSIGIAIFGSRYGYNGHVVGGYLGLTTFLSNIVFIQSLIIPVYGSNSALWSLSMEFWCYVLFYFATYGAIQKSPLSLIVCLCLTGVLTMLYRDFPILAAIWAFGAFARYFQAQLPSVVTWALGGCLVLTIVNGPDYLEQWTFFVVIGGLAALTLWSGAPKIPRYIAGMAGSTYTLYAIHAPMLTLVHNSIGKMPPSAQTITLACAIVLAICCASFVISRLTEAHTQRVRQWLKASAVRLSHFRI